MSSVQATDPKSDPQAPIEPSRPRVAAYRPLCGHCGTFQET